MLNGYKGSCLYDILIMDIIIFGMVSCDQSFSLAYDLGV
jgi:hypothetical protein